MLTTGGGSSNGYRANLIPTLSRAHRGVLNSNTDAASRLSSLQKKAIPKVTRPSPSQSIGSQAAKKVGQTINSRRPSTSSPSSSAGRQAINQGLSSYRPAPAPSATEQFGSQTATGKARASAVTNWVDSLKKSVKNSSSGPNLGAVDKSVDKLRNQLTSGRDAPKLPGQVNLNNFRTEMATIDDISRKYGFDYSREYAEQQAEVLAQAQRDEIEASRARQEYQLESAQTDLEHDFFAQYLNQRQELVDSGLNAGIASERDLRLEMNRQYAMADILANNQLYNQELDTRLGTIAAEEQAYAEQLYNERLQQGFGNAMDYSRFNQSENQWQAQMAMQQRQQQVEERWREFEFNNMSASEREQFLQRERQMGYDNAWREYEFNNMSRAEQAQLIADAERFGLEQAWERHKFDAGLAFESGSSGSSFSGQIQGGSWSTSKGEPPQSFKSDLSAAIEATGYPSSWVGAMSELIARESTWNPNAKNPNSTAHGYGQFLNSTRSDYEKRYGIKYNTPVNQLILAMHYVKDRYGTPQKAIEFHNKNNWY